MADGLDLLDQRGPVSSELDLSPAGCLDLAARLDAEGPPPLSEADIQRLVTGATAACAMARSRILRAVGRISEALRVQRSAWRLARTRREAIALTLEAAHRDEDFLRAIGDADAARDRGAWAAGEQQYGRALALYPLHFGYSVQYGHMLKEQLRFTRAEIAYRNGLVLGAPAADVVVHLRFVCERQEKPYLPSPGPSDEPRPMAQPPITMDVEALALLFWHEAELEADEHAAMLAECPTCEDVALRMMSDRRFVRRNRTLLRVLRDEA
ncbi:MAG TPA: hypothetical protein VHW60_23880 [Caulobacteraceae bacterium]|jgi:hypothetical protein|nr:hypothetical protein [Caulobacteraceae bacterium]